VRTYEYLVELDALRLEYGHNMILYQLEVGTRKSVAAEAVLVADHYKVETGLPECEERRDDIGHQPDLVQPVDLKIVRFLDQGSIAVDKKYFDH
jgi:hypothetical protein